MKISDTSGQDVAVEEKPKSRQRLLIGSIVLVVGIVMWLAVPAVQRWAGSSVSVPKDRLRLTVVTRADLVRDVSIQNQVTTRIRFKGEMPPGLRQNQRLTTRILMEEKKQVPTLQRGQFLDSGGNRVAYVLDADNVAHRHTIEVGARSLAAVEILAGLNEGDIVVISSVDQFQGADTVMVTN